MDDDTQNTSDCSLTPEEIAEWWSANCCHTYAVDATRAVVAVDRQRFSARKMASALAAAVMVASALAVLILSINRSPLDGVGGGDTLHNRISAEEWHTLTSVGHSVGPASAPAVILVFGDYQCVHCRAVNLLIDSLLVEYPASIRFVFRHLPLLTLTHFRIRPHTQLSVRVSRESSGTCTGC